MLPQRIREEGRYRIKGKSEDERTRLLADACLLAEIGVEAVVLELVTPPVAAAITEAITPPTIGIGSGHDCDGQILVTYDLLGLTPWFVPAFVQPEAQLGPLVVEAIRRFRNRSS
jgi:3-methyl-2-oxobutanoate hydroxymethyltransferase